MRCGFSKSFLWLILISMSSRWPWLMLCLYIIFGVYLCALSEHKYIRRHVAGDARTSAVYCSRRLYSSQHDDAADDWDLIFSLRDTGSVSIYGGFTRSCRVSLSVAAGPDLRGGGKLGSCPEASTTKRPPQKNSKKLLLKETYIKMIIRNTK